MNPFRSLAAVLALALTFQALPVQAQQAQGEITEYQTADQAFGEARAPEAFSMIGDLLIARPLLIAATVIGAGAFVISLPFTAAGGNVGKAGKALVVEPGKAAFVRCLGCTQSGYGRTNEE
ncbi:hypothetical protein [Pseudomonas sp. EpS/L25]|uniref:hypothetical protein n=1 Tax=Pseudomonas sp. EpS/L25 TaxID=1749078 RepID=UPI000743AA14|nr:hypothetical protein [Pseudomonas sp. EpS/L25]KUM39837.1 multidrug transporter [Pseudomonas sp. EpS/L25]